MVYVGLRPMVDDAAAPFHVNKALICQQFAMSVMLTFLEM